MNICFFELWGADSQATGGRKFLPQNTDNWIGLKDGDNYAPYITDHEASSASAAVQVG